MWRTLYLFGHKVVVKVYETGSMYGLKEFPSVSKMSISKGGKELFNYDRGLDFNELSPFVYQAILRMLKWIL